MSDRYRLTQEISKDVVAVVLAVDGQVPHAIWRVTNRGPSDLWTCVDFVLENCDFTDEVMKAAKRLSKQHEYVDDTGFYGGWWYVRASVSIRLRKMGKLPADGGGVVLH